MRNNKDEAMKKARQSMELSGFRFTKEHDELILKQLNGEITEEEFLHIIRKQILKKG